MPGAHAVVEAAGAAAAGAAAAGSVAAAEKTFLVEVVAAAVVVVCAARMRRPRACRRVPLLPFRLMAKPRALTRQQGSHSSCQTTQRRPTPMPLAKRVSGRRLVPCLSPGNNNNNNNKRGRGSPFAVTAAAGRTAHSRTRQRITAIFQPTQPSSSQRARMHCAVQYSAVQCRRYLASSNAPPHSTQRSTGRRKRTAHAHSKPGARWKCSPPTNKLVQLTVKATTEAKNRKKKKKKKKTNEAEGKALRAEGFERALREL